MRVFLLGLLLLLVPAESRLAGECAGMCNDLRLEVLTNEMCRYALAGRRKRFCCFYLLALT